MKKIFLLFFCLILLTGCSSKPYEFEKSIDEIQSIEIVSAVDGLNYTVLKTLSEEEKKVFLEQFAKIEFDKYIGDPPGVHGNSIKINYSNDEYEIITWFDSEYVKNGESFFRGKDCDEKEFNELLNGFLSEDEMNFTEG